MNMYTINEIAKHLEEEKAALVKVEREYEQARNIEPNQRQTFIRNISKKKGAVDTLIRLLEKLK